MFLSHMRRTVEGVAVLGVRVTLGDEVICDHIEDIPQDRLIQFAQEHPNQAASIMESCHERDE